MFINFACSASAGHNVSGGFGLESHLGQILYATCFTRQHHTALQNGFAKKWSHIWHYVNHIFLYLNNAAATLTLSRHVKQTDSLMTDDSYIGKLLVI